MAALLMTSAFLAAAPVRLDQTQVIGTHNSYHVAPGPALEALLRAHSEAIADSLTYTHRPLREQLEILGIRQLELDLYADPRGGHFATPRGPLRALAQGLMVSTNSDPSGVLQQPGFKVLHVPDLDFVSRAPTFRRALEEIRAWSSEHPFHFPIFVLLELKEDAAGKDLTPAIPFDEALLASVDAEIRSALPAAQRFEPDQLRRGRPTLREAVQGHGWPPVSELLGRVIFGLDNEGEFRDRYLGPATNLAGKALFVSVPREHPAAAWMKLNDPVADFDQIGSLVRDGFLVRTRADSPTGNARRNDVSQRDRALASGAQFVSTDYPEPNLSYSPYCVRLPGGVVARANPVTGADFIGAGDLEPAAAQTPGIQNRLGMRDHARRRLAEASAHYEKVLQLDPVGEVTATDLERVRRLAPVLLRHRSEPFGLRDVAVVLHPDRPLIAYHLFWDDDIDFPDDNDPCDHEIIWVEYSPSTERVVSVATYFHGQILPAPVTGDSVRVGVEWGKHGSIPLDAAGQAVRGLEQLTQHWRRLHDEGRRLPDHALSRGWPVHFTGSVEDYLRLDVPLELRSRLPDIHRMVRSRWPSAALNQRLLPYNFAVKTGWPDDAGLEPSK